MVGLRTHRIFLSLTLLSTMSLSASTLSLSLSEDIATIAPGDVQTFYGTITNSSSHSVNTADITLQAFGSNPFMLTFTQIAGVTDNLIIPMDATSSLLPLFSIEMGITALEGDSFPLDILLEDADGNVLSTAPLDVVAGQTLSTFVPEPSFIFLLGLFSGICAFKLGCWGAIGQKTGITGQATSSIASAGFRS